MSNKQWLSTDPIGKTGSRNNYTFLDNKVIDNEEILGLTAWNKLSDWTYNTLNNNNKIRRPYIAVANIGEVFKTLTVDVVKATTYVNPALIVHSNFIKKDAHKALDNFAALDLDPMATDSIEDFYFQFAGEQIGKLLESMIPIGKAKGGCRLAKDFYNKVFHKKDALLRAVNKAIPSKIVDKSKDYFKKLTNNRFNKKPNTPEVINPGCFVANTKILTSTGNKNIQDIQTGDLVWSRCEKTGEESFQPVEATIKHEPKQVCTITLEDNSSFTDTLNHPIWSEDRNLKS